MASAATVTLFLLCCVFTAFTDSQDVCDLYAATGTNVTVPLRYTLKESDNLKWLKDATVIFYRRNKKVITGKKDDVDSTGSLKLTQLTTNNRGRYTPEVHHADGRIAGDLQSVRLCVLDRVQKPKVTMTCLDSKKNVRFTCSVGQNEKLEWFMDDEKLAENKKMLMRAASDVVTSRFSCKVSNPVSSEISLPVQQNCYEPYSQDVCDLYAATGTNVTVPLRYTLKESDNLKWLKDGTVIFMRRNKKVIIGKKDDVDSTGSLKLTQLKTNNRGRYTPEVHNADGVSAGDLQSVRLCVLDSQDVCDLYAATGTNVTVPLRYTLKETDNLKWLKDGTVIFHRRNKKVITGKKDDVDSTGSLKLTQLTTNNRGRYTPEVHGADGVSAGDLQSVRLCVLDRVQKPTVMMTCLDSKKNVRFTCSVGQNENFEWFMDDEKLAEKETTLMRAASDVVTSRFSCNVSNPVSAEISLPVQQNCYEPYSQDVCDLYAATGTNVTVPLRYTLKESDNLKWLKDGTVSFMRRNKKVIIGKKDDVDSTGSLKLTQLTTNNRGRYTPEVHGADGVSAGDLQSVRLCVLDRVQKPTVTMTCLDSKKNVRFTCSVGQNENFEWFMDDEKLAEKETTLMRAVSDVVTSRFSCNVSNPVSAEISLPVQQNCYEPYSQDVCDLYAATGTNVTVPLRYTLKESDNLKWLKDGTVSFMRRNKKVIIGKKDDVDSTGSLKLTQLKTNNRGRYTPEVHGADGVSAGDLQSVRLCVLDRVQKPTVTMTCLDSKKNVRFTCSVGQNENFEWFMDDEKLAEKETTLMRAASDVVTSRFSCNVSNPVSAEISLPVQQNCYEPYSQDVCDLYAATGTNVTVPLRYTLKESDNLKWLKDGTVSFMRRNKKVIIGKKDDVDSTGSLKLTQLKTNNRGRYTPEVHNADGVSAGDLQSVRLCVLDRVQKPTVTMTCLDSKKNVRFTCSVGQNENFEWFMDDEKLAEKETTLMRAASDVVTSRFSCNVSNPVSAEISLPVQQNCYEPYSQDVCDLYAATGTNVTVPLRYTLKESDNLKWLKDGTVSFMRRNKKVIIGKKDDVDSTGSLKLTQLTTNNRGRYTPEVHGADGVSAGDLQSVRLCVLDRVQKPTVTMTCLDSKKNVRFTCSVGQNEKLEWFMDDEKLAENKKMLMRAASDVVTSRFSCKVSNPVSSEISLPVQQNCYEPLFPDKLWGISIWVFVGGGAGIVLILSLIVIIC
ncbi:uncharacterized protein LOC115792792 isoform X4 [Archocentrus centrarchus]|uniref:uncharacterized protein LOC115792792 isoform X4 n=1 Tax=Archocentrus centrarchus TaxID=63155 RepID=UPI0011E9EF89|nr:uncharacterized protein LOC115792792 isoform X4 [Archocentrus centrarchus]